MEAKDPDEGIYARIYYYMIRSSGPSLFTIERTDGSLYTNATLDREKEDSYELYIKASNDPDFFMSKVKILTSKSFSTFSTLPWI